MPGEGPGRRQPVTATKQVTHGQPAVETNFAGIAAKSTQVAPMVPSVANALLAQTIDVGEEFVVMLDGKHDFDSSLLPAGAAFGSQLYIHPADNSLVLAANKAAGDVKFGVVAEIDSTLGRCWVNLSERSSF